MLLHVFHFATGLVYTLLAFSSLYILIFSLLAHFYLDSSPGNTGNKKMAVILSGNNENNLLDAVASLLNQSYPCEFFDIAVVTGSLKPQTITELEKRKVEIITSGSAKPAENISKALEALPSQYDLAVILDENSSPEPDFLSKIDKCFHPQMKALQCHRTSKVVSSAIQDTICEEVNNSIFRKGQRASGFSASLSGSGKVFDYNYLKNVTNRGNFEEELDLRLIADKNIIFYSDEVVIYDDHLQNKDSYKQWFAVRFLYFRTNFIKDIVSAFKSGNTDLVNKSLQMAVMPVSMLLFTLLAIDILLIISGVITSFSAVSKVISPGLNAWLLLLVITGFSIVISIPRKFYSFRCLKALVMNFKLRKIY
ncbi:MAG TPA: glycosyltransferase family 2 protein [Bacteroidales bacterium]|nr:glycosyltransferase family 2 protein [Bacteroidales bacterium]